MDGRFLSLILESGCPDGSELQKLIRRLGDQIIYFTCVISTNGQQNFHFSTALLAMAPLCSAQEQ